jgi:hypothetical protein
MMIARRTVNIIAVIELLIGLSTISSLMTSYLLDVSKKPLNVFIFVLATSITSACIGVGLFKRHRLAWLLLVFFSGYIVLTKMLLLTGLMIFTGEIIKFIPMDLKNYISIAYHTFIVFYFTRKSVRTQFKVP